MLASAQPYSRPYLTDAEVGNTADSRYGKVKRWLAQGKLLHIRRGLYCLTDKAGYFGRPHSYELAGYIEGPSYISLESALSYHGLIPEAVYTTTSVTVKRAKTFHTPLGVFSYERLPAENFYIGVERIQEESHQFFMAKPWKAICDYVFCHKKDWTDLQPLLKSLRIQAEDLPVLQDQEIHLLDEYYHRARMSRFLKGIQKELSLLSRKQGS
jgi:hypothetical protein